MIPVNTPEEFERWLQRGPQRRPKAYEVFNRATGAPESNVERLEASKTPPCQPSRMEVNHKPWMPPPPPKESKDFKSAASGEYEDETWDAAEPEEA